MVLKFKSNTSACGLIKTIFSTNFKLDFDNDFIRHLGRTLFYQRFPKEKMKSFIESVNAYNATPYKINQQVLGVLKGNKLNILISGK